MFTFTLLIYSKGKYKRIIIQIFFKNISSFHNVHKSGFETFYFTVYYITVYENLQPT